MAGQNENSKLDITIKVYAILLSRQKIQMKYRNPSKRAKKKGTIYNCKSRKLSAFSN